MGVIQQGILGPISGKVGPVVGGSWKGIAYLRGYQPTVAQPNTAAQVAQKSDMANAVLMAKSMLTQIIKPLNDRWAVKMSGYNLWISRNIEFMSLPTSLKFASLIMSEGSLEPADQPSCSATDASTAVDFIWNDNSGTGSALASDEAFIVAHNPTLNTLGFSSGLKLRSDGGGTIHMPEKNYAPQAIFASISFRSANGFKVSNSINLTCITV